MAKRKQKKDEPNEVNEPATEYNARNIIFFNSFEEQEEYELKQMASYSSLQILEQLRQSINIAYGMHGYNPEKLPQIHNVRIIENPDEHI
ncbi:MAG: hypothetical protein M3R17_09590 [Bacteroidota bacterium]|nr:hypothetical protein [Bacteroidota bacterium]